jgi:hypothetical protein
MAMSDERWEEQFKQFLRKTSDDFRRAGEDIKAEAQRLFDAAMDPAKHQRVRDRLNELTLWARKTADGVSGMVEEAASKAETAFHRATDKVAEPTEKGSAAQRTSSNSEPSRAAGEGQTGAPATSAARKRAKAVKKASGARIKAGKPVHKSGGKRKR